jgi:hypothetical protein
MDDLAKRAVRVGQGEIFLSYSSRARLSEQNAVSRLPARPAQKGQIVAVTANIREHSRFCIARSDLLKGAA